MALNEWSYSAYYCGNSAKWNLTEKYVKKSKRFENLQSSCASRPSFAVFNNVKVQPFQAKLIF